MTAPLPLAHVGILVADLDTSRERWIRVLGQDFSPITRYRPSNWSDLGNPAPHLHDARLTFYLGDEPSFEILEFVGNGTHSPDKGEGGHHLSFPPVADNTARRAELADLGVGTDGEIWHDGRWIFQFADARALNNVYTEWVEEHPDHPDVKDDLSPVNRLPDGSKTLFDVATIEEIDGRRPWSRVVEVQVCVQDLADALPRWEAITGYGFDPVEPSSAIGGPFQTRIRLVEDSADGAREGISGATIVEPDLAHTFLRLKRAGVPLRAVATDTTGQIASVSVDPAYLNGFSLTFTSGDETRK